MSKIRDITKNEAKKLGLQVEGDKLSKIEVIKNLEQLSSSIQRAILVTINENLIPVAKGIASKVGGEVININTGNTYSAPALSIKCGDHLINFTLCSTDWLRIKCNKYPKKESVWDFTKDINNIADEDTLEIVAKSEIEEAVNTILKNLEPKPKSRGGSIWIKGKDNVDVWCHIDKYEVPFDKERSICGMILTDDGGIIKGMMSPEIFVEKLKSTDKGKKILQILEDYNSGKLNPVIRDS